MLGIVADLAIEADDLAFHELQHAEPHRRRPDHARAARGLPGGRHPGAARQLARAPPRLRPLPRREHRDPARGHGVRPDVSADRRGADHPPARGTPRPARRGVAGGHDVPGRGRRRPGAGPGRGARRRPPGGPAVPGHAPRRVPPVDARGAGPALGAGRRGAVPPRDPLLDDAGHGPPRRPPGRPRRAGPDRRRAPGRSRATRASATTWTPTAWPWPPIPPTRPRRRRSSSPARTEDIIRAGEVAPRVFGRLPRAGCEVRPVEAFKEKDAPFAYYFPPTLDGSRPGIYYVNTYDLPSRTYSKLASTTYHEAIPGHHFQISLEMEHPEPQRLPAPRLAARPARPTSRAGACTRSASPTSWACTATRRSAWACSMRRPGGRRG